MDDPLIDHILGSFTYYVKRKDGGWGSKDPKNRVIKKEKIFKINFYQGFEPTRPN
jgi:hypothetical protein